LSGGLSRHTTLVNNLRANGNSILYVDNGGLFPQPVKEDQDLLAEVGFNIFNYSKLDGMNIGNGEFCFGTEYLSRVAENNSFPFLSTNISSPHEISWLKKYIIKEFDKRKIAVLGILPEDSFSYITDKKLVGNLTVISPLDAVKETVNELKGSVDGIILLSRLNVVDTVQLVQEIPEISLAIARGGDEKAVILNNGNQIVVANGENSQEFRSVNMDFAGTEGVIVTQNKVKSLDDSVEHTEVVDTMIVKPFSERRKAEQKVRLVMEEELQKENSTVPVALGADAFWEEVKRKQAELKLIRDKNSPDRVGTMKVDGQEFPILIKRSDPEEKSKNKGEKTE